MHSVCPQSGNDTKFSMLGLYGFEIKFFKKSFSARRYSGTISENQTIGEAELCSTKCNYLQCMFIDDEIYNILQYIKFHIV